jgi:hypothetical protein
MKPLKKYVSYQWEQFRPRSTEEESRVSHANKSHVQILIFIWLILLLMGLASRNLPISHGTDEASKIDEADNDLKQAFEAVLAAENAGANVSGLMARLNQAGVLLAQAEMAYRDASSAEAADKASQCLIALQGVSDEASALRDSALANSQQVFRQSITISSISAVVFLLMLVLVWRWFSRYYMRKLLKMKPEAVLNAEA